MQHVMSREGVRIPSILYGTAWKKERTVELVEMAVLKGFRGIDTAGQPKHYFERGVGDALKNLQVHHAIPREQLYLQTKFTSLDGQDAKNVPYNPQDPLAVQVQTSLDSSLRNLQTDYVDSLILHSPLRVFRDLMEVWRSMEALKDSGKVKQLGISNCYDVRVLSRLWDESRVKPAVLQNRFYADTNYDVDLREFCLQHHILYQSFWTLTANPHILRSAAVTQLCHQYKKTPPQILYRYLLQSGVIPLIGCADPNHMDDDLQIFGFELDKAGMAAVMALLSFSA